MQQCFFCQAELNDGVRFCRACGRMQPSGASAAPPAAASGALTRLCPTCGETLPLTARFCANCGRSLSGEIGLEQMAPGVSAPEHLPGAPSVPGAPAAPQSGWLSVPHAPAGPQSGAVSAPSAPAWPQSGAPGLPGSPAWPQSGVPGAPAGPQSGAPGVPGAPPWPQSGAPGVPGAPGSSQAGTAARVAGRSASKAVGRGLGSRLLGTAAGKVIAAAIAVVVVATGGAAAVAVGHNPIATVFQQITGSGANHTTPPQPELTYIGSDGNIWDVTLPQGKPRQLTNDAKPGDPNTGAGGITYFGLAWSLNGKQLAVIRATSTDTSSAYELLMLSPGGSLLWEQSIPQSPLSDSLAWSPDGRFIAYSQGTGNLSYGPTGYDEEGELVIVDARTGSITNTLNYDAGPTGACGGGVDALTGLIWSAHNAHMGINTFDWSQDGQKMLVAFDDAGLESALVALSNGATTSGYPEGASFQPGGHFILGSGGSSKPLELTDLAGKQVRILANSTGAYNSPYANQLGQATWSSDGKAIYYEYQDSIWRINVDGSGARQIIAGTQIINNQVTVELAPRLSPDGSRLLYLEARGVIDDTGNTNGSVTAQWYSAQADGSGAVALPQGAVGAQQYIVEAIWRPGT